MIKNKFLPALLLIAALSLIYTGCKNEDKSQAPPPPKVTVSKPIVRQIVEWDEYTGRLDAVDSVEVRARVSGYLESKHFKEGEIVDKGQLLFVIDPRPFEAALNRAKGELELARAKQNLADSNLARAKKLLDSNAISKEEFDTRKSEAEQAKASLNSAQAVVEEAELNLNFTQVKSPIRGRISRELVTEGNLINGGTSQATLLTTIVSLNPIYCYFEVDENSYLKYADMWNSGSQALSKDESRPVYISLS
ncbi:MAG: efflux RND transporter periplasmic adaptor subunit, partial [Thermodesulfobacteriota bacterium]